jgi:hypothetical protein
VCFNVGVLIGTIAKVSHLTEMVQSRRKRTNSVSSLKELFSAKPKAPLFTFYYPTDVLKTETRSSA